MAGIHTTVDNKLIREVTNAFATAIRSMFRDKIFERLGLISLHRRNPSPIIRPAIWVVFPPGAAHRSQMASPGWGSSRATGAIALASCK